MWHFRSVVARILNTFNEIIANKAVDEIENNKSRETDVVATLKNNFLGGNIAASFMPFAVSMCAYFLFVVLSVFVVGFVVLQNLPII